MSVSILFTLLVLELTLVGSYTQKISSFDKGSMLPESVEALRGMTLLILGCRKTDEIEIAPRLGLKVIIVTTGRCNDEGIYHIIPDVLYYDMTDHTKDWAHAFNIISMIQNLNITIHGCCTYDDDLSVLAAIIAKEADLSAPEIEGVISAKKKSIFFQKMISKDQNPSINVSSFAVPAYQVQNQQSLSKLMQKMEFPLILKLEHGIASAGVRYCKNRNHCISTYRHLQKQYNTNVYKYEYGFGFGNSFVLMQFIKGSEHGVDIIIYKGELITAFIKDKFMTLDGRFLESISIMPSNLAEADQEKIILASYQTCLKLGLNHGVFNLDIKLDRNGPKVIEVNGRMGGHGVREWINHLYKFDITLVLFQVSLGIRPKFRALRSCGVVIGMMMTNSSHFHILERQSFKDEMSKMGEEGIIIFKSIRSAKNCGQGDFERVRANLAVVRETVQRALISLLRLTRYFHIADPYDILRTLHFIFEYCFFQFHLLCFN